MQVIFISLLCFSNCLFDEFFFVGFSHNYFFMPFRPFGRLWWNETVPTVVTRAEPHNQVLLLSLSNLIEYSGLLFYTSLHDESSLDFVRPYCIQSKTESLQSERTPDSKDFLIITNFLAPLKKGKS